MNNAPPRHRLVWLLAAPLAAGSLGCDLLLGIEDRSEHLVTLHGQISTVTVSQAEVTSVRICLPDVSPEHCTTPDDFGRFTLRDVPGRARQRVTYSSADVVDAQQLLQFEDKDRHTAMLLIRENELDGLLKAYARDESLPLVTYFVTSDLDDPDLPGLAGYDIELAPLLTAVGPLQIDPGFSVTKANETSATGAGFFLNVPPGQYELLINGSEPCAPDSPSAASTANRFDLIATTGLMTVVIAECRKTF